MLSDVIVRLIRTWVPIGIGYLISVIPGVEGIINQEALIALCIAGYYALAAVLEEKVWYGFGWLLGVPKAKTEV